jgi:diguanylate cyclase (GGDEF)-like protein
LTLVTSHIIWITLAFLAFIAGWLMTKLYYFKKIKDLEQKAITDPVTGLYNYKEFNKRLLQEIAKSQRYKTDFTLLLIDIDNFKNLNTKFGYKNADKVLLKIVDILQKELRQSDTLFRYRNGDEFTIIAPNTGLQGAQNMSKRLEIRVSSFNFVINNTSFNTSISIECSSFKESGNKIENTVIQNLLVAKTLN